MCVHNRQILVLVLVLLLASTSSTTTTATVPLAAKEALGLWEYYRYVLLAVLVPVLASSSCVQ